MRKISVGLVALGAAASMALAACSSGAPAASGSASGQASSGEKPYIAIVSKGFQHQFWQAVKQGAEQQAAKDGVTITFEGPATESEVEAQMNMLTAALAKKPAALGFAALDSKAAAPVLQQFKDANIPVVAFDSGVDSDIPVTTAATDNKAAAAEAAKHMCELVGGAGTVGVMVHDQTSRTGQDRRDGFIEGMKATCPNVKVLDPQYGKGDPNISADIASSIIEANKDLKGIFLANEGTAIGGIKATQQKGMAGKLVLIGFDSGTDQINAINDGTMAGAITQNPVGIGEQVVAAAVKTLKGETVPKVIDTGFYWYDKTNINDAKIQAVLYK
ncbi:HTH-type transcriptional repressor PurR [Propionicimonas sp. T2.31MG-18]|uniref:ABC transporter substrate-binding protein n=1 Tax=Propionicimonas sp. T2.31MG-18 TaxID=3157620 RepID=UPI0035ECB32B